MDDISDVILTGVDNIITDYVVETKETIDELNKENSEIVQLIDKYIEKLSD